MKLSAITGIFFALVAFAGAAEAQIYTPLNPFSKFTCVSFPDGTNKIAVIGKNNRLTTFPSASKAIATELSAIRERIRTLNQLKKNAVDIEEKGGLLKKLDKLTKKVLGQPKVRTAADISAALTQMETILSGQSSLRQQELSSLRDCKSNKPPLDLDATLKVGVLGDSSKSVVALAVVTSGSVGGGFYCATVPTDNFGTIGTRTIKDQFDDDPCSFASGVGKPCGDLVGAGNRAILIFSASYLSDPGQAALEGAVASFLAFYPALIRFTVLPNGVTECP